MQNSDSISLNNELSTDCMNIISDKKSTNNLSYNSQYDNNLKESFNIENNNLVDNTSSATNNNNAANLNERNLSTSTPQLTGTSNKPNNNNQFLALPVVLHKGSKYKNDENRLDKIEQQMTENNNQLNEPNSSVNKPDDVDAADTNSSKASREREHWDHKIEFLLAIIGFSVDLGNIWRFPKIVYENGGGRFLVPYFVQLILCGLPLFYMELALGQFHQTGLFTLWEKICPILKGLAFTTLIINLFMAMFYNTVIAWSVYYLFLSFKSVVPWKGCENKWNTFCCFPINDLNRIPTTKNHYLNTDGYHKIYNNGLIYRSYNRTNNIKRVVLFDTRSESEKKESSSISLIFDGMSKLFNLSDSNEFRKNFNNYANETSIDQRITTILKSFFVVESNELKEAFNTTSLRTMSLKTINKYHHDPSLLINSIENLIDEEYVNKTASIVLNCAELMNNPTQEFYNRYLTEMHKSTGIEDFGSLKWELIVSLFVVFVTVYFALWKGIKSAGKAVWITATAPYLVLFILLVRGMTLEGCMIGIDFYLRVNDWMSLFDIKLWIEASTQIFFSLGPGFGTIIALSSYNKKKNNIYKDALLTSFINCFTSILSGFVVFSTLGHMAHVQGKKIQDVAEIGPGLIFITYPQAISMMPFAPFWAVIFFFMLFTLGIDSTFGGLESVITAICDNFPKQLNSPTRRSWLVLFLVAFCFLGALPTVTYGGPYIVHLFDNFTVAPSILFVAFFETIGVMYVYGCDRFCDDIYSMINSKPSLFWKISWKFISPLIILLMTVMICTLMVKYPLTFGKDYSYEGLGERLAAVIVLLPLSFIIIYPIYRYFTTKGETFKERLKLMISPTVPWIKSEKTPNESDANSNSSKRDKSMKALVIINFNTIKRDSNK